MKKPPRILLCSALVAAVIIGWIAYRWETGRVLATARATNYVCRVRELPSNQGAQYRIAQLFGLGSGLQVYLCEVASHNAPISSSAFTFAGSFQAQKASITIHDSNPDERYKAYIEFDIDGYHTRCDFLEGESIKWDKL